MQNLESRSHKPKQVEDVGTSGEHVADIKEDNDST
jgi:hypothetical protein